MSAPFQDDFVTVPKPDDIYDMYRNDTPCEDDAALPAGMCCCERVEESA